MATSGDSPLALLDFLAMLASDVNLLLSRDEEEEEERGLNSFILIPGTSMNLWEGERGMSCCHGDQ